MEFTCENKYLNRCNPLFENNLQLKCLLQIPNLFNGLFIAIVLRSLVRIIKIMFFLQDPGKLPTNLSMLIINYRQFHYNERQNIPNKNPTHLAIDLLD